jgi:hypothetical protein
MRSMRDLKLMSDALLGPKERMLLKFQHKNIINLDTSSSDSDNYTYDTVKLMNSENNFVKLGQIVKINKILKQYKGKKLEKTDKNLIKGVFKNRPHKPFHEDEELENLDEPINHDFEVSKPLIVQSVKDVEINRGFRNV